MINDEFNKDRELPWWEIIALRPVKLCLLWFHHAIGDGLCLEKIFHSIIETSFADDKHVESEVTGALMKRKMTIPSIPSMVNWQYHQYHPYHDLRGTYFYPKQKDSNFKYSGLRQIVFFSLYLISKNSKQNPILLLTIPLCMLLVKWYMIIIILFNNWIISINNAVTHQSSEVILIQFNSFSFAGIGRYECIQVVWYGRKNDCRTLFKLQPNSN